ncbi:MAG: hypothetical protein KAY24_01105 [Candidatus Eisenbacteria sp.]|nr:hypothetical protein [Candidatus Eisenbacteria bacterium]
MLEGIKIEDVIQWLYIIIALVGVIGHLRSQWRAEVETGKKSRWDFIRDSIPEIHGVVQRIAKHTRTKKDDEFVAAMSRILKAFGFAPVSLDETEAVKALGSGYHQEAKAGRIDADLLPLDYALTARAEGNAPAGSGEPSTE